MLSAFIAVGEANLLGASRDRLRCNLLGPDFREKAARRAVGALSTVDRAERMHMRILVCGINYAPELIGVAKYTTELCEGLLSYGHEVRVMTAPPYYPEWKIPEEYRSGSGRHSSELLNGISVTRSPIYVPARPSGMRRLLHHASFAISSAAPILLMAFRWRPDIVFTVAPSLLSAPVAAMAARITGVKSWLHVQDLEVDAAFELGLLRNRRLCALMLRAERRILRAFDRVSTISPQMLRRLVNKGVAPERLRDVRNWVDTSTIVPGDSQTPLRACLGLEPTDIVALYSGSMSKKQGLELIIEAATAIRDSHPQIHFVLCGNGPHRAQLAELARGLPNTHIIDIQPAERLSELLNTADIHLLPQKAQAADLVLPSKLSGMLASGRPIIAMAEHGTGIALETQGAGLVVPPGDAAALAAAIAMLATDEVVRKRLGETGRLRAQEHWDRASIIRSLERELSTFDQRRRPLPERLGPASTKRHFLEEALRESALSLPPL
jgi:colanic acid biosynthesis glycosyl transferase WcaI